MTKVSKKLYKFQVSLLYLGLTLLIIKYNLSYKREYYEDIGNSLVQNTRLFFLLFRQKIDIKLTNDVYMLF